MIIVGSSAAAGGGLFRKILFLGTQNMKIFAFAGNICSTIEILEIILIGLSNANVPSIQAQAFFLARKLLK